MYKKISLLYNRLMWKFRWSFYIDIFSYKTIHVHWADFSKFNNFGDILNAYLIKKITNRQVKWVKVVPIRYSTHRIIIGIGSIVNRANSFTDVWGAGLMNKNDILKPANYFAVRGPRTVKRMKELNIEPPKIIGDPALLLPLYYAKSNKKEYDYGLIPHHIDFNLFDNSQLPPNILLIDITLGVERFIDDITSCSKIISSSLHGLIVANTYNIPCVWVQVSDRLFGDDTKFYDYFESVNILNAKKYNFKPSELSVIIKSLDFYLVEQKVLENIRKGLLQSFNELMKNY